MKLIIGLGNPGAQYKKNRHNLGFMALDYIQKELKLIDFSAWRPDKKFQAELCQGEFNQEKIILAKPQTFMNNSGRAVQALAAYYKIPAADVIVIHDDIDLPLGAIKTKRNSSSAGHNGVKSIIEYLGTQDFTRIRIGAGKDNKDRQGDTANFVMRNFNLWEKTKLSSIKKQVLAELEDQIFRA